MKIKIAPNKAQKIQRNRMIVRLPIQKTPTHQNLSHYSKLRGAILQNSRPKNKILMIKPLKNMRNMATITDKAYFAKPDPKSSVM